MTLLSADEVRELIANRIAPHTDMTVDQFADWVQQIDFDDLPLWAQDMATLVGSGS